MGIGLLVSLLFSLVPLLRRAPRPAVAAPARESAATPPRARLGALRRDRLVVGAGLVALAAWQAGSLAVGRDCCRAGFAGWRSCCRARAGCSSGRWRPLRHSASFPCATPRGAGEARATRPGAILLAVGLGAFLVVGVRRFSRTCWREFQLELAPDMPDMFLIDVQPDQAAGVTAFLAGPAPGVRGRPR